ncbi:MAG: hypothetical protein MRY57_02545 [Candidatus Pacebacteria bacterium]|nr:hypothetical protein [Candidatus Paceibacterota bacterium]
MSYRYDRNRKNKQLNYGIATILLILALFTPVYGMIFDWTENIIARSWKNKNDLYAETSNFFQSFVARGEILERNQELEREIERLEVDNIRTRYLSDQLEATVGLRETADLVAPILEYGSLASYDNMIIGRGESDGVSVGDQIIISDTVLIGYVSDVFNTTARVTLYSNADQSVTGILYPHNESLVAQGAGGSSFIIDSPREIEVVAGDILYALNQPGNIIAVVKDIEFDPRDPFKKVYLTYPVNIKQHTLVGIKKPLTQAE